MRLYHGTTKEYAKMLLKNGWSPLQVSSGSNQGKNYLLYLTTDPENARWFSQEKGEDVVLAVEVSEDCLIVDPEDGIEENVEAEIFRSKKLEMPAYLALKIPLGAENFSLIIGNLD